MKVSYKSTFFSKATGKLDETFPFKIAGEMIIMAVYSSEEIWKTSLFPPKYNPIILYLNYNPPFQFEVFEEYKALLTSEYCSLLQCSSVIQ